MTRRGATVQLYHAYDMAALQARVADYTAYGVGPVMLVPHYAGWMDHGSPYIKRAPFPPYRFLFDDVGQDTEHAWANTTPIGQVEQIAWAFHNAGHQVTLRPTVDFANGGWRGWAEPGASMSVFWQHYRRMLLPYVYMAKDIPGAGLVLGCEWYRISRVYGAKPWIALARWVRSLGFRGPLSYSANWGNVGDAEWQDLHDLWAYCDTIGIDYYWPLSDTDDPSIEALRVSQERVRDILVPWAASVGKPLTFYEVGYPATTNAARTPWDSVGTPDDALQLRCAQSFVDTWYGEPSLGAVYYWTVDLVPDPTNTHELSNRPAVRDMVMA